MASGEVHVVTGAFGYSGKYIARRLLDAGCEVRTLTNSPDRPNPFGPKVKVCPFHFDDPLPGFAHVFCQRRRLFYCSLHTPVELGQVGVQLGLPLARNQVFIDSS